MIGCHTCVPSNIACRKHCPAWVLDLLTDKKRREILRSRKGKSKK